MVWCLVSAPHASIIRNRNYAKEKGASYFIISILSVQANSFFSTQDERGLRLLYSYCRATDSEASPFQLTEQNMNKAHSIYLAMLLLTPVAVLAGNRELSLLVPVDRIRMRVVMKEQ